MKDHRVRSCKVVPVPDEHYGEQACAVIECKNNQSITTEEVIDSLKNNLADYKIPAVCVICGSYSAEQQRENIDRKKSLKWQLKN